MADQFKQLDIPTRSDLRNQARTDSSTKQSLLTKTKPYLLVASVLTVNNLVYNTLFIILGAMSSQRNYDEKQIGFLGSAFLLGQLVSNLSGVFWVNKVNWRFAVGGSALACGVFMAVSAHVNYPILLCFYLLAGSMTGIALSCMFCHMSGMSNPVRAYAVSLIMQCLVAGTVIIILQSFVLPHFGFIGLSYTIAIIFLMVIVTAPKLPTGAKHSSARPNSNKEDIAVVTSSKTQSLRSRQSLLSAMGLFSISVYFLGQTSIWAFIERIGNSKGFSADSIGTISAAVLILCALGAWAANVTALRLGKFVPILIGIAGFLTAIAILYFSSSKIAYFFAFLLYASAWNYVLPYQLLMVSQDQKHSVFASVIPAFQSIGASAGPAIVGSLVVGKNSYLSAYLLSSGTALASISLFFIVYLLAKKQ